MPTGLKLERKNAYLAKLVKLVEETPVALIVNVNNVGSKQLQNIRLALRGECVLLMGKNTMIRKALRMRMDELKAEDENADVSKYQNLLTNVNGNIGYMFCQIDGSLEAARAAIDKYVLPAAAKAGVIAPVDYVVPAGPTSLEPSATSFFQALNIPTKIIKGAIEITSEMRVITKGEKVTLSATDLLSKLGVKPFEYGMKIVSVYQDGEVFPASVLDIDDSVLISKFLTGVSHVAAFGREVGIPTAAGMPHMFIKAFKNIVAACVEIEFEAGEKVAEIKAILSDPEALAKLQAAAAAPAGGAAAGGGAAAAGAKKEEAVEEEEEDMDFDLFG